MLGNGPFRVETAQTSPRLLSKLCSVETLVAKLGQVVRPSKILRRLTKDLRKNAAHLATTEVLFYSKENHDYDAKDIASFAGFDGQKKSKSSDNSTTEEKLLLKFCSKLNREIEKSLKRSQSEQKSRAKKLKSANSADAKSTQNSEWDSRLWLNLHGPNWVNDQPYMLSLMNFYKSNPLDQLMSVQGKEYGDNGDADGKFAGRVTADENSALVRQKFSWVKDDEQTLENFEISAIFPENLKCDESLAHLFEPFRFAPVESIARAGNAHPSSPSTTRDGPSENMSTPAAKYMFWTQSESVLKAILKFSKKNRKGLLKERADDMRAFFEPLSLWHQKCLTAVLPFGYCAQKDYSLVALTPEQAHRLLRTLRAGGPGATRVINGVFGPKHCIGADFPGDVQASGA